MNENMTAVVKTANDFNNDLALIQREIKRLASVKTRLKKNMYRADYDAKMTETLRQEQLVKSARDYLASPKKTVTTYTQADVDVLTYDETVKAIRSIQSKKSNSAWLTAEYGNNDEYRAAVKIEQMLKEHLQITKPVADNVVKKSDIKKLIETIEAAPDITVADIIDKLNQLV